MNRTWQRFLLQHVIRQTSTFFMGRKRKPPLKLDGPVGATMESYINYKKVIHQICNITSNNYRFYLHDLLVFLNNHRLAATDQVTPVDILLYVNTIRFKNPATQHAVLLIIKGYLRHLHHHRLTPADLSMAIPRDNYKSQAQLPSTFSRDQVIAKIH